MIAWGKTIQLIWRMLSHAEVLFQIMKQRTFDEHNPLLESTPSPQASTSSSFSSATERAAHEENSKAMEQTYQDKVADKKEKILSSGRGKS